MFVASHRCPECSSTNVMNFAGDIEEGVKVFTCNNCGNAEIEKFYKFVEPSYMPGYRKWEDHENVNHVNIPLREDGVRFWRETYEDDMGQIFTNIRPYCDDGTGFEWGHAGTGPTRFAMNIIEAVLRDANYDGGVMDSKRLKGWTGVCYRWSWKLKTAFKEDFITSAPDEGGTIPYAVVIRWLSHRISDFKPG